MDNKEEWIQVSSEYRAIGGEEFLTIGLFKEDMSKGRWMSTDPYGQHYSPYLAMGNNPMMMIDPDGGFNVGATLVGAVAGFAVGSLIGLAVDEDNWWKYGVGGAIAGGIAGIASGDITISENADFITKTRAEVNVAFGKEGFIKGYRQVAGQKASQLFNYAPGISEVSRAINIRWVYNASSGALNGYARLRSSRKYTLEGVTKVMPDINVSDQNDSVVPGGSFSANDKDVVSRTPFLSNPQDFSVEIPEHSTRVNLSFSQPYVDGHISNYDGYWKFRAFSRRTNKSGTKFKSRQFAKKYVRAKVRRIHKKTNGGKLF